MTRQSFFWNNDRDLERHVFAAHTSSEKRISQRKVLKCLGCLSIELLESEVCVHFNSVRDIGAHKLLANYNL